ncbi:glycoside hydrolase family 10 protein [Clostridium brassicae]|uniref:Glycosyl hydrolase-like 10 domain-containing protein n=1 Tax=Clostridium brassicae TaxID=2999072 RepID=A0ABT4DAL8_9CLOT|nr:hypothetical protein [Clostridium brassicae]MCY6959365.1 hypothetical protein [Clostridium brassicae]
MKKFMKRGLPKIMFMLLLLLGVEAKAADNPIVDKDKIWKIVFSSEIRYDERTVNSIKVLNEKSEKVDVRIEFGKDKKTILVKPPVRGYVEGESYTLNVGKEIYSKEGNKHLGTNKKFKFSIKAKNPFQDMITIKSGDEIKAEKDKQYVFNRIDKLLSSEEKTANDSGWNLKIFKYNKLKDVRVAIENKEEAKELKLPAKLDGWLGVYIGYLSDTEEFKVSCNNKEGVFKNYSKTDRATNINETFMFADDFKDGVVTISPIKGKKANITYIKIVSLNEEQIKIYNEKDENKQYPRVVYDDDGYTDFFLERFPNVSSLSEFPVNLVSKANVGELNWTLGTTGLLNYNSLYAGKAFEDFQKYEYDVREGDKKARDQILNILDSGKSPLEIIANKSKNLNLKVNACLRMNAFYSEGFTKFLNGAMYKEYEDCLQNEGANLSYYYPKYRNYILNVLKEASKPSNVSGITLDFCRYPQVMGSEATYEEKVSIMNYFMRKVREEIPNKKITVRIPYLNHKSYGLDVENWFKEGLVDRIVPSVISYEEFYNLDKYVDMVKGTNVELYIGISANLSGGDPTPETEDDIENGKFIMNRYLSQEEYLYRAYEAYKNGADGVFLFNTLNNLDVAKDDVPSKLKYLGNKTAVEKWYKLEYPAYRVNYKID